MTPEEWRQVAALFHAAIGLDAETRDEYLRQACKDNPSLRAEVDALLATDPASSSSGQVTGHAAVVPSPLATGMLFGVYRVERLLGQGGMGEVYKAYDTKLGRDVALKILSREFAVTPDRLARFAREARMLAALNHPHIAAIYGTEESEGVRGLVLELVEGETLASKLTSGRLPQPTAIRITRQVAEALEAAHDKNIIHRDLKPTNIMITPNGTVKVLDFGLAKVVSGDLPGADLAQRRTGDVSGTHDGAVLGTVAYMSPEQTRGHPVDKRTDIWAFGCVLYEMLTGRRTFQGGTTSDTIAAILEREPDWSALPQSTPPQMRRLLERCLRKDSGERLHTIAHARIEAEDVLHTPGRRRPELVVAAAAAVVLVGLLVWSPWRRVVPEGPTRAGIRLAVLQPHNPTGQPTLDSWTRVTQALIVGELTGVEGLGVMDPDTVNTLIETSSRTQPPEPVLRALARSQVGLVLHGEIVAERGAYGLHTRLVDSATGDSRLSANALISSEGDLVQASADVAVKVLMYLQLQTQAGDKDLRPWIASRTPNLQAVKAFLQANTQAYQAKEGTEPFLRSAIALDPLFIAPRIWLTVLLNGHGNTAEAQSHYTTLTAQLPNASPFERTMIAFTGAKLARDTAEQERQLRNALQYSPNNNILLFQLAGLQVAGERCVEALDTMAPAVAMRWQYRQLYPLFGWCAVQTGRIAEALPVLRDAAVFDAPHPRIFGILEAVALASGDAGEAATWVSRYAATHQPPSVSASLVPIFTKLGREALARGQVDRAIQLFQRAVALNPDDGSSFDDLSEALLTGGKHSDAETTSRKAIALDGRLPRPHRILGDIALTRGQVSTALGHYRAYIALESDATKAAAVREKITRLEKQS